MDKLEKHITQNKKEWEDKMAPDLLWEKIEKNLDLNVEQKTVSNRWMGFLLVGIGFGLLSVFLWNHFTKETDIDNAATLESPLEFAQLEDFQETEHYYLTSINMSMVALEKMEVDATLMEDLSQLDVRDKQLREEYKTAQNGYKEQVLHALIRNHQAKLGILERVLFELKNTKENEII